MGISTISTGPFSISQTVSLPGRVPSICYTVWCIRVNRHPSGDPLRWSENIVPNPRLLKVMFPGQVAILQLYRCTVRHNFWRTPNLHTPTVGSAHAGPRRTGPSRFGSIHNEACGEASPKTCGCEVWSWFDFLNSRLAVLAYPKFVHWTHGFGDPVWRLAIHVHKVGQNYIYPAVPPSQSHRQTFSISLVAISLVRTKACEGILVTTRSAKHHSKSRIKGWL